MNPDTKKLEEYVENEKGQRVFIASGKAVPEDVPHFRVGEVIPLKGWEFEVERVQPNGIFLQLLRPTGATMKRQRARKRQTAGMKKGKRPKKRSGLRR